MSMNALRWILIVTLPSASWIALARFAVPTSIPRPDSNLTPLAPADDAFEASMATELPSLLIPSSSLLQFLQLGESSLDARRLLFLDLDVPNVRLNALGRLALEEAPQHEVLLQLGVLRRDGAAARGDVREPPRQPTELEAYMASI